MYSLGICFQHVLYNFKNEFQVEEELKRLIERMSEERIEERADLSFLIKQIFLYYKKSHFSSKQISLDKTDIFYHLENDLLYIEPHFDQNFKEN